MENIVEKKEREVIDLTDMLNEIVKVNKLKKNKLDLAIEGKSQASVRALTAAEKERTKQNSIFLSNTDRFK
jgi:hypothetical protein